MKNDKDAFKKLQHSLENLQGHLHVLETNVPVEKQMEYFRFSDTIKNDLADENTIEEQIEVLQSEVASSLDKQYALSFLAISGNVKAYRAIEAYNEYCKDDWSEMSLMQAKITLESEFSDEKQIFISTGLGGKGDKLRFYAFFKSNSKKKFSDYQKKLIEKEIPYYINSYQGTLEKMQIEDLYFTLLFLIHIRMDIKTMLEKAVEECNQYGDFINNGYIITNVKVFSEEEIQKELAKKE